MGDVCLLLAEMVGPEGRVTGLDFDPEYSPVYLFDGVVGRHILIHTPDPLQVLRRAFAATHHSTICGLIMIGAYSRKTQ